MKLEHFCDLDFGFFIIWTLHIYMHVLKDYFMLSFETSLWVSTGSAKSIVNLVKFSLLTYPITIFLSI